MNRNGKLPARATDFSDRQLWLAMRQPAAKKGVTPDLTAALRLGRAGKFEEAAAAMAAHHRQTLAKEWKLVRGEWLARPAASQDALAKLFRHEINVWHHMRIQFGPRIDWWPAGQVTDNLCGLHRLHWLAPALTAWIQGSDPKSRDFVSGIVAQYAQANQHPNWAKCRQIGYSFLEITAKWAMLLPAYLALIQDKQAPGAQVLPFLRIFLGCGRSLAATLGEFSPGYNAQAVGFSTLLHLARAFPEFAESPAWDEQACALVLEHARRGFYADGGTRERIWGYGIMHLSALSKPYAVAARFGGFAGNEAEIRRALRQVGRWYVQTVGPAPKYCFPTFGDSGWGDHDRLPTVQRLLAEALPEARRQPLLGVDRSRGYCLKPSGFAVLRNGDGATSVYANLNFGEFAGWHSHWDLLSMNFWAFGEPLLEEVCRFGPYANPLNTTFYAPEGHNQTLIDGMIYDSRLVRGEDVQWYSDAKIEYFSAYHRAYRFFVFGRDGSTVSPNMEAKVRRTLLLVKDPGYMVVLDSVENLNRPAFTGAISQYWHAPLPFEPAGPGAMRTGGGAGGRPGCLVLQARTENLHRLDTSKDFGGEEVAHLGSAFDRFCLRARRWMPINHQGINGFATVLWPFTGKPPKLAVRPLPLAETALWRAEAFELDSPAGTDVIMLNPELRPDIAAGRRPVSRRAEVRLGNGRGRAAVP